MSFTTNLLLVAVPLATPPEFMRLPCARQRNPVFGLSRSSLNELILPCTENKQRPPVRSGVLRRRGARTGVRLVDLDSLRAYLDHNVEPAHHEPTNEAPDKT